MEDWEALLPPAGELGAEDEAEDAAALDAVYAPFYEADCQDALHAATLG